MRNIGKPSMPTDDPEPGSSGRVKWTILISTGLLIVTVVVALWLAFAVNVGTTVTVDPGSGAIVIEGPESDFAGSVHGVHRSRPVTISGLPGVEEIREDSAARRAFCAVLHDPTTDWSQASEFLRAHLHSERVEILCAPFS